MKLTHMVEYCYNNYDVFLASILNKIVSFCSQLKI
jgi:hypothetical protein